jgi:hypothetical protein
MYDVLAIVEADGPLCFDCGNALAADPIVSGVACPCVSVELVVSGLDLDIQTVVGVV